MTNKLPANGPVRSTAFLAISFFILLVSSFSPNLAFSAAIRIMPLGDSITHGSASGATPDNSHYYISYRKALRDRLVSEGYEIDFVGSLVSGDAVFNDAQHEGHPGWVAAGGTPDNSILPNVYGFLTNHPPDIVLLHIGTNDVGAGHAEPVDVAGILDEIDRYSVDVWVILALIVNQANPPCAACTITTNYNDGLDQMAEGRTSDKVVVVDMETGAGLDYRFSSAGGDMYDTLHPFATGYDKMADNWLSAILQILPRAAAGPDQLVNPGSSVALVGSGSSDTIGNINAYSWVQTAGSPTVALSNAGMVEASFTAPDTGVATSLTFRLTISDDKGFSHSDTCVVNVNVAPVANAGLDQQVNAGDSVTLDGTNSHDPDGTLASYGWVQTAGSPIVVIANAASNMATFTAPAAGAGGTSLTFRLTVTDNRGSQRQDSCVVHVNGPPVANAGEDQVVNPGEPVALDGMGSTDADGTITAYEWTQTGGSPIVALSDASSATARFTAPAFGSGGASLAFRLTVTDNRGQTSNDTCIVHVNGGPAADAGPDQSVHAGDTVTLDGSGSTDPDDGILSYAWTQVSGVSVSISNPHSPQAQFVAPSAGVDGVTLIFQLTVTDHGGLISTSTCTVSVTAGSSPPDSGGGGGGGGGCFISAASADNEENLLIEAWKGALDFPFLRRFFHLFYK